MMVYSTFKMSLFPSRLSTNVFDTSFYFSHSFLGLERRKSRVGFPTSSCWVIWELKGIEFRTTFRSFHFQNILQGGPTRLDQYMNYKVGLEVVWSGLFSFQITFHFPDNFRFCATQQYTELWNVSYTETPCIFLSFRKWIINFSRWHAERIFINFIFHYAFLNYQYAMAKMNPDQTVTMFGHRSTVMPLGTFQMTQN